MTEKKYAALWINFSILFINSDFPFRGNQNQDFNQKCSRTEMSFLDLCRIFKTEYFSCEMLEWVNIYKNVLMIKITDQISVKQLISESTHSSSTDL